jgi:ADP-ribosylglycohydrolase
LSTVRSRVEGTLVGLAAGDRIGGPTGMALQLAASMLEQGGFDRADIRARYLTWWKDGGFDTGTTAARVFSLAAGGNSIEEAAALVDWERGGKTAGCNPAHRIAPLAMCSSIPDSDLAGYAGAEAALTHRHPLAGDVAAAVAVLTRNLIRGLPWPEAIESAASGRRTETRTALLERSPSELSTDGFAPHVLAAACQFVDVAGDFASALEASLRFAGAANFSPVLVGAIGGARWGIEAIPSGPPTDPGTTREVRTVAGRLGAAW